jgi:protein-tyrosine phosphatase
MVDIHSHVLWGLDDGPETLDESLAMLRMAAASGTTDIVATPHSNSRYNFDPAVVTSRIEELSRYSGLPRVHRGCDFHLSALNIDDALRNPAKYTINSGRYLMVELPETFSPDSIGRALGSLSSEGMLPVITHPERNQTLQRSPATIERWIDSGSLSQVTAQSLTGRFGTRARQYGWQLLRSGHVHFIASDAHDAADRLPRLDIVRDVLRKEIGESLARLLLVDHPQAAIDNRDDPMDTGLAPQPRKWYQIWRP